MKQMYQATPSKVTYLAQDILATDIIINVIDGSKLPDAPNILVIGDGNLSETIIYTIKNGNELSGITRGVEGTNKSWQTGTIISRIYTAFDHNALIENIDSKVDKVIGKQLSTEDYTTENKTKLEFLKNYVHPNTHPATMIETDSTHRFVTDAEKTSWTNGINIPTVTTTQNGLMLATDKVKVDTLTISSTQVGMVGIAATTITSSQSVALGQQSGVSGASGSNTAVGFNASAKVTNGQATAIGASANAGSGSDQGYGTAVGAYAVAYNIGVAVGSSSNGSGKGVAIGYGANTNSKNYAIAKGYNTVCQRWNEEWKCSDGSSGNKYGYGQNTWYASTTNATQTEIFLGGTANQRFTLLASSIVNFSIQVAALNNVNNIAKTWKIEGAIKQTGSGTSIVGSLVKTILAQDTGAETWDVIVSADTTNNALKIEVVGEASKTIRWNASSLYSEARF